MHKTVVYGAFFLAGALFTNIVTFIISPGALQAQKREASRVIEKIGSVALSTRDYEDYYKTSLDLFLRKARLKPMDIGNYACKPPRPGSRLSRIFSEIYPETNYERYRLQRQLMQEAKREKFHKQPAIKRILDYVKVETITSLYIREKVDTKVKISDSENEQECQRLRRVAPRNVGHLTLDACMEYANAVLNRQRTAQEYRKLIKKIQKKLPVKAGRTFNKTEYLKSKFPPFNELKKINKCKPAK